MRYYEIYLPGESKPALYSNVRKLRNLPSGTRVTCAITDRDGSLAEVYDLPVVDGRVEFANRNGMRNPKLTR